VEVNDQVVSQGIVFASIMAGFAFVIAAEIALREPIPKELEFPAFSFLGTGLFGIVAAAAGVFYFGTAQDAAQQSKLGIVFLGAIGGTGLMFLRSILSLFRRRFAGKTLRDFYMLMAAIIALVVLMIWRTYR
jgi:hypothetical protein